MRAPYIIGMADDTPQPIDLLIANRDHARAAFFAHGDPGNLTPAQRLAFQYRNMALLLLLKAAQIELDAELHLHALIAAEENARWDAQIAADVAAGKLDALFAPALDDYRTGRYREPWPGGK